jgi:NAD(P)-dependent dehydrogenase (short-subunit alcohol dehydrogenase family)
MLSLLPGLPRSQSSAADRRSSPKQHSPSGLLFPGTKIVTLSTDVTDMASVNTAFGEILKAFGRIDVLVNNAGAISTFTAAATSNIADWWTAYETNVKGSMIVAQAFLHTARKDSFLLNITTGLVHMPVVIPAMSSYVSSKLAAAKLFDYIAWGNPHIHVVNLQPGAIKTDLNSQAPVFDHRRLLRGSCSSTVTKKKTADLPGHFAVWLVSKEAEFLKGKFVWANWDVEELIEQKHEILKTGMLTIGLSGLSF